MVPFPCPHSLALVQKNSYPLPKLKTRLSYTPNSLKLPGEFPKGVILWERPQGCIPPRGSHSTPLRGRLLYAACITCKSSHLLDIIVHRPPREKNLELSKGHPSRESLPSLRCTNYAPGTGPNSLLAYQSLLRWTSPIPAASWVI